MNWGKIKWLVMNKKIINLRREAPHFAVYDAHWCLCVFYVGLPFPLLYPCDADSGQQCPQRCGWDETNSHGVPSPVEEKGWHGHSLKRRASQPLPWQAFIAFLGTLRWGWSSFTMHRFALGGYLLQKTERMLLITWKRKDICKCEGKSC